MNRLARHTPAVLLALSCGLLAACAVWRGPDQNGGDLPKRLRTQVALGPSATWRAPDLREYSNALKPTERPPIDPGRQYDLLELIDVAQRVNPETHVAWERARQAAIAVGLVESEYFPMLTLAAFGGYQTLPLPAPQNLIPDGFFRIDVAHLVPGLGLKWLLLDFGRRGSTMDGAKERLLAANLGFNRRHQDLAFRVQRAFYALTSIRARIAVAQSPLDAARAVQGAAESRYAQGLETVPEVLLARQQAVQAEFDLEDVAAKERAQVALAESIGILPTTPLQVVDFSSLALPPALQDSVESGIDRALEDDVARSLDGLAESAVGGPPRHAPDLDAALAAAEGALAVAPHQPRPDEAAAAVERRVQLYRMLVRLVSQIDPDRAHLSQVQPPGS